MPVRQARTIGAVVAILAVLAPLRERSPPALVVPRFAAGQGFATMETWVTLGRSIRMMMAAALACGPAGAIAARRGGIADPSRGVVTITASVAGQVRLSDGGAGLCPTSNSATRLLAIVAQDALGTRRTLTADGFVAAPLAGCATVPERRIVVAGLVPAPGTVVSVLVSPE